MLDDDPKQSDVARPRFRFPINRFMTQAVNTATLNLALPELYYTLALEVDFTGIKGNLHLQIDEQ